MKPWDRCYQLSNLWQYGLFQSDNNALTSLYIDEASMQTPNLRAQEGEEHKPRVEQRIGP